MNFLSGRNIFLILDAFKDEVWAGPEDNSKVTEETHFTTKGKEDILTETSEAQYSTGVFTQGKKRLVRIAREMFFTTCSLFISNYFFSR
jgi:hypothetical protein